MAFEVGDIVMTPPGWGGERSRYAVAGFISNPRGGCDVKVLRKLASGAYSGIQVDESRLRFLERPVFKPGDKVLVDGHRGQFMSFETGGDVVRVMLASRKRSFTSVGFIDIGHAVARMNYAILVVENRKSLMESDHGNHRRERKETAREPEYR